MERKQHTETAEASKIDVKSEVAKTLIDAMERGNTPWQKPWAVQSLKPVNLTTNNGYRGINRLLLALSARCDAEGRADPRWATYQQAQANGWKVKSGEKGTPIVKLVEVGQNATDDVRQSSNVPHGEARVGRSDGAARGPDPALNRGDRKTFALRRYVVFNAQQMDGAPELEAPPPFSFNPVERAEGVLRALNERTGLVIVHGGDLACYLPASDQIHIPHKKSFASVHEYYSTALHEGVHSTLHEKRMARHEALAKRWGDKAYAMEELRAEICSAIMAAETGVPMGQAHIDNHAAYLRHWIGAVRADPMAIFSAAKDADQMADYMLGLERQVTATEAHKEWVAAYNMEQESGAKR